MVVVVVVKEELKTEVSCSDSGGRCAVQCSSTVSRSAGGLAFGFGYRRC